MDKSFVQSSLPQENFVNKFWEEEPDTNVINILEA